MNRNLTRTLLILLTVAALVVIALPGSAKPPEGKGKPPADEPRGGTVCGEAELPEDLTWFADETGSLTGFTFTLSGKKDGTCIDVVSDTAGPWHVTIEAEPPGSTEGGTYLVIVPRDSISPGDSCGGWLLRSRIYDYGPANPLVLGYDGEVPAATVNACGTGFAEWVDPTVYDVPEDYECAATDAELGCLVTDVLRYVAHPLALQVLLSGRDGTSTRFTVDLP